PEHGGALQGLRDHRGDSLPLEAAREQEVAVWRTEEDAAGRAELRDARNTLDEVEAVSVGEPEIDEHEGERLAGGDCPLERGERVRARRRPGHGVAEPSEQPLERPR